MAVACKPGECSQSEMNGGLSGAQGITLQKHGIVANSSGKTELNTDNTHEAKMKSKGT